MYSLCDFRCCIGNGESLEKWIPQVAAVLLQKAGKCQRITSRTTLKGDCGAGFPPARSGRRGAVTASAPDSHRKFASWVARRGDTTRPKARAASGQGNRRWWCTWTTMLFVLESASRVAGKSDIERTPPEWSDAKRKPEAWRKEKQSANDDSGNRSISVWPHMAFCPVAAQWTLEV